MQNQFLHPLKYIAEREMISDMNSTVIGQLLATSHNVVFEQGENIFLIDMFCRFLKLNKLR